MIILLLASSCKKDRIEEVRPTTFADFEKIMQTDLSFNNFINTSLELENLTLEKYKPSFILKNTINTSRKKFTISEQEELKKIKNFSEMKSFLSSHNVENASKIVDLLEKQSLSLYTFLKKYPEYDKLSFKEKQLLISKSIKAYELLNIPTQMNSAYVWTNGKLMFANGDPMQAYGIAIQGCQNSYRTNFIAATATADIALFASLFDPTGIAYVSSALTYFTVIYFLDQERGNCMNLAAELLYNEL